MRLSCRRRNYRRRSRCCSPRRRTNTPQELCGSQAVRMPSSEEAQLVAQHAAELQAAQLQAQIQVLLAAAKDEYAAGALWQPSGANAELGRSAAGSATCG